MTPHYFLYLATILFAIGLLGITIRKNLFVIYLSIELMLSSVNIILATFSKASNSQDGSIMALLMIAVIASEASIFLAIIVYLYKSTKTIDTETFTNLRNEESI